MSLRPGFHADTDAARGRRPVSYLRPAEDGDGDGAGEPSIEMEAPSGMRLVASMTETAHQARGTRLLRDWQQRRR